MTQRRARCWCAVLSARCVVLALVLFACVPRPASAYSVLAHEACIDALWTPAIQPLLERRYPRATPQDLQGARAYAYGGSVIQDLGYYPFGSKFLVEKIREQLAAMSAPQRAAPRITPAR